MDIGAIKQRTLMVMNEYSKKGAIVPIGKNADYLNRMNIFINDAQLEVAKKQRIEAIYPLGGSEETLGPYCRYYLPSDLWAIKELRADGQIILEGYEQESDMTLLLSQELTSRNCNLVYYRYPSEIDNNSSDNTELEVKLDGQVIIPFYVGAKLQAGENDELSIQLLNEFYDKLDTLNRKPKGRKSIIDVRAY